ncbi:hypothetical protein OROMI_009653 [Orobanche minor]
MGDKIQASISVGLKRKFLPLLKEGHIILIKKFQVLENKPNFQRISANMIHHSSWVSTMKHTSRFFIRPDIQEVKNFILRRGASGVSSSHTIFDISNDAQELNNEEWLNAGSLRIIKKIVNSDAVGTYTSRGTIVDLHPEESWYYQSCGNNRCYKGVPKGSKVWDCCKKCSGPIGSIIIRYLMKVFVADGDKQAYFTFFEDCALYFLKKIANQVMEKMEEQIGDSNGTPDIMSIMECLLKMEVTVRFGDRVYTVKNVTEDAELMAEFSSISYAEGDVSTSRNCGTPVDDNVAQEDHVTLIEEISSSSTMSEITPQKRRLDSYLSHVDTDGGDLTFSSTKVLKK